MDPRAKQFVVIGGAGTIGSTTVAELPREHLGQVGGFEGAGQLPAGRRSRIEGRDAGEGALRDPREEAAVS